MSAFLKPLLLGACAITLAACATTPPTAKIADAAASKPASQSLNCIRSTGTRITLKDDQCTNAAGRVFTQEELEQTGAFSVGEALQRLDPRFSR